MLRLAALGGCGAGFQTLVARELLTAFSGSEAVLASMMGAWLSLTAAGAFVGGRGNVSARRAWLVLAAYGPAALASVLAARLLPLLFDAGAAPGPLAALSWAFALLALPCFLSGFGFATLAGGIPSGSDAEPGNGVQRAYLAESLGAAATGAALSLFLLGKAPAFTLGLGLAALSSAAALAGSSRKIAAALAVGLAALPFLGPSLDTWTADLRSRGPALRSRLESPYGSIEVGGKPGEATVFVDRRPVATAADVEAAEETAHLPAALHPSPRAVAIVGVAPVGAAQAFALHGAVRIDYLIEDESLLGVLRAEFPDFSTPGAHLLAVDPRRHLAEHHGEYDLVVLSTPEPGTAQQNRAFTVEFFQAAAGALRDGGLVAVALPGHAASASDATRRLHSSLMRTLEAAVGPTRVFPMDRTVYLAAKGGTLPAAPEAVPRIVARLAERGVAPKHLTAGTLGQLLSPARSADADRWASMNEPPNRDLHPTTYRLALDRLALELGEPGLELLALLAMILGALAILAFGPRSQPVPFAVLTTGASSLATQLVLMLAYQIGTGALYREVGLVLAGFMLGAAGGAALGGRSALGRRAVLWLDLAQLCLPLALVAGLPTLLAAHGWLARALVFAVAVGVGLVPGTQFAAAARCSGGRPGALYGADLVGAAIASLSTFTFLVPAMGLSGALAAAAGLKLVSSAALLQSRRSEAPADALPKLGLAWPLALATFVLLAAGESTEPPLYAFTFLRGYQTLVVAALLLAALAAFEPRTVRETTVRISRRFAAWRDSLGAGAGRLAHYALLLPVAAFPIARCYFKVPFVFCHVCPRQCVFGVLRPYAVPAAVLANLQGHRFCERLCPLGAAQGFCERAGGRRARRWAGLWLPRAAIAALVALAWFWARADRGEGISGGPFYSAFFVNAYAPSLWVLGTAAALLTLSLLVRRPFCEALCPIGAAAQLTDRAQRRIAPAPVAQSGDRRLFLRRSVAGCGAALLGTEAFHEFALRSTEPGLALGFRNDAPAEPGPFSRPASFAQARAGLVRCELCPHACILGENDRGFCRTRVVKRGKLLTVAYGNLCSAHLDPIEKKPLYHYLPRTPILSVATGGCNLRCLNCQNWEISQRRPEDVATHDALPPDLVAAATAQQVPALAYTYSEPLMAYEYVRDSAALARERGVRNVLVTAGYINERPLRELCRVLDAVTLDVKAFRESFYKEVSGGRLAPVLRTLEVLQEEKVWTEVSFLMVPSLSDSPAEIGEFAGWVATHLGSGTPFHILRFHPAHRLEHLAPTPVPSMEEARKRSMDAGLHFVYLGNVPGHESNHTHCPRDGRVLIEREGFDVKHVGLVDGRCPCGEPIPGVWT